MQTSKKYFLHDIKPTDDTVIVSIHLFYFIAFSLQGLERAEDKWYERWKRKRWGNKKKKENEIYEWKLNKCKQNKNEIPKKLELTKNRKIFSNLLLRNNIKIYKNQINQIVMIRKEPGVSAITRCMSACVIINVQTFPPEWLLNILQCLNSAWHFCLKARTCNKISRDYIALIMEVLLFLFSNLVL